MNPTEPKSILLVDDHPLFREGLKSLIERCNRYRIHGEASCGAEALDCIRKQRFDIITMDLSLPDMSGMEVIRRMRDLVPHLHILVVSMHAEIEYIQEAFQAGAMGYLAKEATGEKLIFALDAIAKGEHFLDGLASQEVVARMLDSGKRRQAGERYDLLSPREQEVFRLAAGGMSNREIAESLNISPKTADNHRSNLMKKLGLHNRLELVRYAVKIGLIDTDKW